jgi:hypothetical protein
LQIPQRLLFVGRVWQTGGHKPIETAVARKVGKAKNACLSDAAAIVISLYYFRADCQQEQPVPQN